MLVMQDYYSADDFLTSEIQQHDYFYGHVFFHSPKLFFTTNIIQNL